MTLQLGGGSRPLKTAAPKLSSALSPYQPINTVSPQAAIGSYQGIAASFPSFVAPAIPAAVAPAAGGQALSALGSVGTGAASDYGQQLADLVAPTARAVSAQAVTNAANLSAQRRQAIAQFGYVPANLSGQLQGDVNADINDETRGLAQAATASGVSTYAQLQKAYHDQQASDWATSPRRNMVHSGAAGQHAQADLLAYNQGYEQSIQKLMDYLQQAYQTKLTADATGQQTLSEATDKALQQIIAAIQANQYLAAQQPQSYGGGGMVAAGVAVSRRRSASRGPGGGALSSRARWARWAARRTGRTRCRPSRSRRRRRRSRTSRSSAGTSRWRSARSPASGSPPVKPAKASTKTAAPQPAEAAP